MLLLFALLVIWLLFLTGAATIALSLLVIGAVPIGLYYMCNAAARVTRGEWPLQGEEVSAIADRCVIALVVVAAVFALISIWQIDIASVASCHRSAAAEPPWMKMTATSSMVSSRAQRGDPALFTC